MKDKLLKFAPILMFVAVLGLAAGLVYMNLEKAEENPNKKAFDSSIQTINSKLGSKSVDPAYPQSPEKTEELKKLSAIVENNVTRPTRTIDDKVGFWVSFPQPSRPRSDRKEEDKLPVDVYGAMKPLSKIDAQPDQGAIFIKFDIPEPTDLTMMELVRVEVYRGKDEKSIDMKKPIGTVELGPEEGVKAPAAGGTAPVPAPAAEPPQRIRGQGGATTPPPAGTRGNGGKPAPIPVPKYTKTYKDTDVDQKTAYVYKLRLIGRFTSVEGKFEPNKKADGSIAPGPGFKHHAPNPKDYTSVTPRVAGSTAQLFALPLSAAATATTPSNFALRLEGIIGDPPKPGQPRNPASPLIRTYAARFEVRAWIGDLGEWKNDHIEVKEGDSLTGTIKYRPKDSKENKTVDYTNELGYKFLEVVLEEDKNSKIKGVQIEVAILENQKTKQKESFPKASNPKAREESLKLLDAIWKEQEELKKKSDEVKKAGMEKIKADAANKATNQPAQ